MSIKRKRDEGDTGLEPSKQFKRERVAVDLELVEIYDRLADQKESKRLKAASRLVKKLQSNSSSSEDIYTALRRLFRGLCSTRKAARQGFAIALTELLAQLASGKIDTPLASEYLVSIWEDSTAPDSSATKQEERDHFLGRVFGADAILRSGILTTRQDREQWKRFLGLLCAISLKKPWLRQECGWLLYQFVLASSDSFLQPYAEDIIESLSSHKLIRTPEGVAIWLSAKKSFPKSKMAKHVWKHGHPLASKDVKVLSDIMKDAKMKSSEDGNEAQGAATWSVNLHFAWQVVLDCIFKSDLSEPKNNGSSGAKSAEEIMPFQDFWHIVGDEGLFGTSSSPERKQWGVLVWSMALEKAPPSTISQLFTKNGMHCLITALNTKDSYRRKAFENTVKSFESRIQKLLEEDEFSRLSSSCVKAILVATDYSDVDRLTKSKLLSTLLTAGSMSARNHTIQTLELLFEEAAGDVNRQKYIVELESKVVMTAIRPATSESSDICHEPIQNLLLNWASLVYGSANSEPDLASFIKERLERCLESCLRIGSRGRSILNTCVKAKIVQPIEKGSIKCDKDIQKVVRKAWRQVEKFSQDVSTGHTGKITGPEGLSLLYCVLIMEVAGGEADAVESLRELSDLESVNDDDASGGAINTLVELLLSLASRTSKFSRMASHQIFESIAPQITKEGLESLTRVLQTRENAQGQQEMLIAADDGEFDMEELEDSGSDVDDFDSDVEVIDASDANSSDNSASDSDVSTDTSETSEDDENNEDDSMKVGENTQDEELAALDAALASALGTRKLTNGDADSGSSDSDSDMDDNQMMALDEKLTEVFKARKDASDKKREQKDTKEAFIAFKNRVLDLVEIYVKQEYRNGLAINLILPLLQSVRTTQTKQIADRTCNVLRQFYSKAKGQDIPRVGKGQAEATLALLKEVHAEACLESSNAHAAVCSGASILVVKVLLGAKVDISQLVDVYSDTRKRQLKEKSCKVQPAFFTDWNNWCSQARNQLAL